MLDPISIILRLHVYKLYQFMHGSYPTIPNSTLLDNSHTVAILYSHQSVTTDGVTGVHKYFIFISEQVAQLRQKDRASSVNNFKGWVNLRLNLRLKGYFSRHCDMTQFMLTYSTMSMFMFRVVRYGHIKMLFYGIKRPVCVIVSMLMVYHQLKHPK